MNSIEIARVSIIIPVFNSQLYLEDTLESIIKQTYDNWECICVDDHSEDESLNILKEYARIDDRFRVYLRPGNLRKGGNSCRNYGFSLAKGEFIQWFDSDDLMDSTMLEKKLAKLGNHNYVVCRTAYFENGRSETTPYDQNLNSKCIIIDYLNYTTKFFTPGPLFRRTFVDKFDLFDVDLRRHQEKEFFFRIILNDHDFSVVDEPLIFRRLHENQLSTNVNKSSEKIILEFVASKKIFDYYKLQDKRSGEVDRYFRVLFFKFSHRLIRQKEFSLGVKALKILANSLII